MEEIKTMPFCMNFICVLIGRQYLLAGTGKYCSTAEAFGHEERNAYTASLISCQTMCDVTPGCMAVSYAINQCYLEPECSEFTSNRDYNAYVAGNLFLFCETTIYHIQTH